MIETGKLIRIEASYGVVEMHSKGGCHQCSLKHTCGITGPEKRELKLPLPESPLFIGDIVDIETPARSLLSAAFLVFILPLILSGMTYAVVLKITGMNNRALLSFFAAFILSELLVIGLDRLFGRSTFFEPRILGKSASES